MSVDLMSTRAEWPVYKGEDGFLYMYCPDDGALFQLRPGDFRGKAKPLPGNVKGIGDLNLIGMFKFDD